MIIQVNTSKDIDKSDKQIEEKREEVNSKEDLVNLLIFPIQKF